MTDTPTADAEPETPADRRGAVRWFASWSEDRRRNIFLAVYAVALLVTAAAIWMVAVAPGSSGEGARATASQGVLLILGINLILIGGLAVVVGRRALMLFRRRTDAGARLHLRFVTLFSMVALIPAVLIALVFGVLVNRGVDQWFSDNVQSAVENGAHIGKAYVQDVSLQVQSDLETIADELAAPEARTRFATGFSSRNFWPRSPTCLAILRSMLLMVRGRCSPRVSCRVRRRISRLRVKTSKWPPREKPRPSR